jgi:hypothetical protein
LSVYLNTAIPQAEIKKWWLATDPTQDRPDEKQASHGLSARPIGMCRDFFQLQFTQNSGRFTFTPVPEEKGSKRHSRGQEEKRKGSRKEWHLVKGDFDEES